MIPGARSVRSLGNPWKQSGVFRCSHGAHDDFAGSVSPYHVLREKRCFPQGCLYFRWRCARLEKGRTCKRKFSHVGRLCAGCNEYEEEKIHQQPQLLLAPGRWLEFQRKLEEFEQWFEHNVGRCLEISAQVTEVKPWFRQEVGAESRVRLHGFVAVLSDVFLERVRMEAPVYMRCRRGDQVRHALRAGDVVDLRAYLKEDRGRLVLDRLRRLEVLSRGDGPVWDAASGLVAGRTATTFRRQPERCLQCPAGTLLDVERQTPTGERRYRRLLCMEGQRDPLNCDRWTPDSAVSDHR